MKANETKNSWKKRMIRLIHSDVEPKTSSEERLLWVSETDFKREAGVLICAAQEKELRTNDIK